MKTITAATLRKIVRRAASTTTTPTASKGRTIRANVQSSFAKIQNVPNAGGTGIATSR